MCAIEERQFRPIFAVMKALLVVAMLAVSTAAGSAGGATPKDSPAGAIARGDSCWNALDSWCAFQQYTMALRFGGSDVDLAWRMARVYTAFALTARSMDDEKWNQEHAKQFAERAVAIDPNNMQGHLSLAVYYGWHTYFETDNEGRLRISRLMHQEVTRALELDPKSDFAWNIHGQWNREVAKLSWMEKLVVKMIYGGLPDASFEQSERDLKHAIELAPGRIMHYVELGKTYRAMGDEDRARAAWQQALSLPHVDGVDDKVKEEARKLFSGQSK
jgi:tetratricopeptide (TPR) repeat protein